MKKGWTYKKLGEVFKTYAGGTPSKANKANYINGTIPWLRSGEVCKKYITESELYISEEGLRNSSAKYYPINTVLIAMYGATAAQCGILKFEATSNQAVCGVLPQKDFLPEFVYSYFVYIKDALAAQAQGGAQPNISQEKIKNVYFPCIPLSEQKLIVSRLDAAFSHIDELKANAEKQLSEARALFQKSLAKAMEPKEGWEEKTLTEISLISGDYGLSVSSKPFDGVRYIRITDITDDGMLNDNIVSADLRDSKKKEDLIEGDILFARTGATVGKTLVYKKMFGECLYAGYLIRYRLKTNVILPQFIHYVTHTDEYYKWVLLNQEAAAQPNISAKKYNLLPISYPPLSEQQRIVERLDALSAHVRELEENQKKIISECDALKQALLRKVFE